VAARSTRVGPPTLVLPTEGLNLAPEAALQAASRRRSWPLLVSLIAAGAARGKAVAKPQDTKSVVTVQPVCDRGVEDRRW